MNKLTPLPPDRPHKRPVNVNLSTSAFDFVDQLARTEHRSRSQVVDLLLRKIQRDGAPRESLVETLS